jgi:hypothetical protein
MKRQLLFSLAVVLLFNFCSLSHDKTTTPKLADSITKVEMHLSAFGVESDDIPSIDCFIDFTADSSKCEKWYYNPAHKSSTYKLSNAEIVELSKLLHKADLEKLKTEYRVGKTDQPTSITTIYAGQRKFTIKDYGLEGEYPLQELYRLVYKF